MTSFKLALGSFLLVGIVLTPGRAGAQDMPAEYQGVLTTLGKTGDFKDGVLKVNIPRSDLKVTIDKRPAPTPFGFGGWVALTKGDGMDVMMGDLVLTEDEVNPVMSALLQNGLDVTALHNHFFWEQPRIFYMHVHGMGSPGDLATRVKPAIDLIDQAAEGAGRVLSTRAIDRRRSTARRSRRSSAHRVSRTGRSTRSRSAVPTSTCASTAHRSTRGWA